MLNMSALASYRPARVTAVSGEPGAEVYSVQLMGHYGQDRDGNPLYLSATNAPNFIPAGHVLLGRPRPGGGLENAVLEPQLLYDPGDVVAVSEMYTLANPDAVPDDNTPTIARFILGRYVAWVPAPGQFVDPPLPPAP